MNSSGNTRSSTVDFSYGRGNSGHGNSEGNSGYVQSSCDLQKSPRTSFCLSVFSTSSRPESGVSSSTSGIDSRDHQGGGDPGNSEDDHDEQEFHDIDAYVLPVIGTCIARYPFEGERRQFD